MSAGRGLLRSPVGSPMGDSQPPGVPAPQQYYGGHKNGERPGELGYRTTGFAAPFDLMQCNECQNAADDRDGQATPPERAEDERRDRPRVGRAGGHGAVSHIRSLIRRRPVRGAGLGLTRRLSRSGLYESLANSWNGERRDE
jgi:hypothetical protein